MKLKFQFWIIAMTLMWSLISCIENELLHSKFTGFWASTEFTYEFYSNNEFVFSTAGHYGFIEYKGRYEISDSLILLYPITEWNSFHGVLKRELIFRQEIGCLQDMDSHFYCQEINDYPLIEKIKSRLLEQKGVIKVLSEYPDSIGFSGKKPEFQYDGTLVIERVQYHIFQLRERYEDLHTSLKDYSILRHCKYLINIEDNLIYKHHSRGDTLSLEGILFENKL